MRDTTEFAARYAAAMDAGADEYRDVVEALAEHGLRGAEFTQTGGMCAAIHVPIDAGYLLITDQFDSLSWRRTAHAGWCVGVYIDPTTTEAHRYVESPQGDVPTLLRLVDDALGSAPTFDADAHEWRWSSGTPLTTDEVEALGRDPGGRDG